MLFNSIAFFVFFPIVTVLYFLLPYKYRWALLLIASCVFYCFFIPIYISILFITILIDYFLAIYIERNEGRKRKFYLVISIVSTCLVLFIFKYFNFFNDNFAELARMLDLRYPVKALNIILPIGLSFHTFQSLSYVIEVFRGNQKAEKHFGIYSLYVMFYPQLVAGPIERPQNVLHQFYEKHDFNYDDAVAGLKQMARGFFKKVVIADRLSIYVSAVYGNYDNHTGNSLLVATIFFAFQIYADFSGYSDIAIGAARVMGFRLMTNFNRPYFARSVSEFWKRWHISLSTWFRDYVYIPLGGNRRSKPRNSFNLFFTFLLSGFWHGANWTYIIWGGLNGFYLIVAASFKKYIDLIMFRTHSSKFTFFSNLLNIGTTFILICFTWIFFRANNLHEALSIIEKIISQRGSIFTGADGRVIIYPVIFLIMLLSIEFFEEYHLFNNFSLFNNKNIVIRRVSYVSLIMIIILFGVFDNSQFIYFQF